MAPQSQVNTLFKNIPVKVDETKPYKKRKIPAAIREAVWIKHCGRAFEHKCATTWCQNTITAFDFQCGHNIPESKGGTMALTNLYPLCARCNVSMGDRYTIDEWNAIETSSLGDAVTPATKTQAVSQANPIKRTWRQFFSCVIPVGKPPPPRQPASPSRRANR
jgi:hypothetical protein